MEERNFKDATWRLFNAVRLISKANSPKYTFVELANMIRATHEMCSTVFVADLMAEGRFHPRISLTASPFATRPFRIKPAWAPF